ncbi:MAG: hypothetical protein H0T11_06210 [Chthoniobacterales bacterium]|nr:hypothetical protein [Chthoniobacterales bacterium]
MRTTIRMNEELARRAKQFAARTDRTFTQVVAEAVMELLAKGNHPKPRERIVLPTSGDASHRMTEEEYRAMIEQMYEEEAERYLKGGDADP